MNWLQKTADSRLEARLDTNDYDEASLIEIRVPLDMPYQTDRVDFERFDGEINVDGTHYKYVKRKVQDGVLILKCIPHEARHRIESARDYFFQLVNDLQDNKGTKKSENSKPSIVKFSAGEFETLSYLSFNNVGDIYLQHNTTGLLNLVVSRPHSSPEQPPDA
jgi:hypothetical protein